MTKKNRTILIVISAALIVVILGLIFTVMALRNKKPSESNVYLVNKSNSEYNILIPKNADEYIKFAADELKTNFKKASGAELNILSDDELSEGKKYISIGQTELFKKADIELDYNELTNQGYKIQTLNDNIYCVGLTSEASLYAVYGFLEHYFDYCYYKQDYVYVKNIATVKIDNFNTIEKPDTEYRVLCTYETDNYPDNRLRLRIRSPYEYWGGYFCHTYFKILSPEIYYNEHPDWYSPDGINLCLTHVDRNAFAKSIEEAILANPDATYISIGQQDNFKFCDCDDCKKKVNEWLEKGAYSQEAANSALVAEFSNEVADIVGKWVSENCPERNIKLVVFAYNATRAAPCKLIGDKFEILDEKLKYADNLAIQIVPYNSNMFYSYTDVHNSGVKQQFDSWSKVADDIFVYMYDINFSNYLQPFLTYGSLPKIFNELNDYGAEYIMIQSQYNVPALSNFQSMKDFVSAKLLWDNSLNVEDLINDYMMFVYKDAGVPLKEYLDLMMNKFAYFAENGEGLYTYDIWFNGDKYWSYGFLQQCMSIFDKAYQSIEHYKYSNYSLYEELCDNILRETFYVRQNIISIYGYELENENLEQEKLKQDMLKFGIVSTHE